MSEQTPDRTPDRTPDQTPSDHCFDAPLPAEYLELLARFLNGPLEAGDLAELEAELRSNPAARRVFVRFIELDGMLMERSLDGKQALPIGNEVNFGKPDASPAEMSGSTLHDATVIAAIHDQDIIDDVDAAIDPPMSFPKVEQPRPTQLLNIIRTSAAVLLLCGGLIGYLVYHSWTTANSQRQAMVLPPPTEPQPVAPQPVIPQPVVPPAILSAAIDAHFKPAEAGQPVPVVGEPVPADMQNLASGWIKIDLSSGVSAIIQGPARFRIDSAARIHLSSGRLTARVSQQGRGFTVESDACRVVDLGTDFGVLVTDAGSNEVQVFQGQVALSGNNSTGAPASQPASIVAAGQARRVAGVGAPAVEIPPRPDGFVRVNQFDRWTTAAAAATPQTITSFYEQLAHSPGLSLLYVPDASTPSVLKNRAADTAGKFDFPLTTANAPSLDQGRVPAIASFNFHANRQQGLVIPDYPATQTGKVSVMAWVKLRSYEPYASIVKSWGDSTAGVFHFGLTADTHQLEVQLDGAQPDGPSVHEDQPFPLNQWVSVAFVSDGATARIYRDGRQVASGPSRPISLQQSAHALSIGFKTGDDGHSPSGTVAAGFWNGQIGEIAIFDRALSPDEIVRMSETGR
jgi:hypothetical protein